LPEGVIGYELKDERQFFALLQAVVGLAVLVFFPGFIKGLGKAVSVVEHLSLLARHGGLTHRNDRSGELGASPVNPMSRTLAIRVKGLAVLAGRDCEGENSRPIDYLVASFFLLDGFAIDDVMGLSVLTRRGPML
jgi:hypothetical protein